MADKKDPPLQIDVDHPEKNNVRIKLNGMYVNDFVMVDVLGCVGVRYARDNQGFLMQDDDGCAMTEKLWGNFVIEWMPEPDPAEDYSPFMGIPFDGMY